MGCFGAISIRSRVLEAGFPVDLPGPIAQLEERFNGIEEAVGSSPIGSTRRPVPPGITRTKAVPSSGPSNEVVHLMPNLGPRSATPTKGTRRRRFLALIPLSAAAVLAGCGPIGGAPAEGTTGEPQAALKEAATASPAADSNVVRVPPYDPADRSTILARYAADAARVEAVLASGRPVLIVTDAIW